MVDDFLPSLAVIALIGMIPLIVAVNKYKKYKIKEYIYFIGFWGSGVAVGILLALEGTYDQLIYWQIRESVVVIFFSMVYFQALRVINFKKSKTYRSFVYFGIVYLIFAELLILMWKIQKESDKQFLLNLPSTDLIKNVQVGVIVNGTIVYSASFLWIRVIFGVIAFWTFFYAYFSIKKISDSQRIRRAHTLWKIAAVSGVIFNLFQWLPGLTNIDPIHQNPFALISVVAVATIAILYPEGYIIGRPQIERILEVYNLIEHTSANPYTKLQMNQTEVYDYLIEAKEKLRE